MAERNPLVEEWIVKAEGDWDWTEVDLSLISPRMRDGYVYHLQQLDSDTSTEELLELKEMASRLRQVLLLRLGSTSGSCPDAPNPPGPHTHTHEQWLGLVQPMGLVVAPAALNALLSRVEACVTRLS